MRGRIRHKSVFPKASSSTFKTLAIIILRRTVSCNQHYLLLLLLLVLLLLAKSQYKFKNLDRKFCKGNHFPSPSLDTSIACVCVRACVRVCVCVCVRERERERERKEENLRIWQTGWRTFSRNSAKFSQIPATKIHQAPSPRHPKRGEKETTRRRRRKEGAFTRQLKCNECRSRHREGGPYCGKEEWRWWKAGRSAPPSLSAHR